MSPACSRGGGSSMQALDGSRGGRHVSAQCGPSPPAMHSESGAQSRPPQLQDTPVDPSTQVTPIEQVGSVSTQVESAAAPPNDRAMAPHERRTASVQCDMGIQGTMRCASSRGRHADGEPSLSPTSSPAELSRPASPPSSMVWEAAHVQPASQKTKRTAELFTVLRTGPDQRAPRVQNSRITPEIVRGPLNGRPGPPSELTLAADRDETS